MSNFSAKEYTKKLTLAEKESKQGILIKYSASMLIDKNVRRSCNIGYLFLQDIYYSLGLDKICSEISGKYKFEYDLNDILSMLVFSRILTPGSKRSSLNDSQTFLEQPKCDLHQIYRALEVISKENEQPSMTPLEQKTIRDFDTSDFIVCTDAGLSSTANRKFNSIQGRGFVTTPDCHLFH